MFGLDKNELKILRRLDTPEKIQDFLDKLPINFEERGETLMSPRRVLRARRAHCLEGALLAAAALALHGRPPLLMDFKTDPTDEDHVVALFKEGRFWGAISKTNHSILRYRDAVYKTPRELAMSFFHEYYDFKTGRKTMRSYSQPFNLNRFSHSWVTREDDWWELDKLLERYPHIAVLDSRQIKALRPTDKVEVKGGMIVEWRRKRRVVDR